MERKSILGQLPVIGFVVVLGALTGCASNSELAGVKTSVDKAQQTASAAQSSATAANSAADAAAKKADQAAQAAQSASSKADQALQGVNDINEKLERMFKKGMQK